MNWVGGARSRIKQKHERKIQKEFFERKRHAKKVFRAKASSPASSGSKDTMSQDMVALKVIMKAHDQPRRKPAGALRKPQQVNMDHTPLKVLGRRPSNVELPESPEPHKPSSLELNTARDDMEKRPHNKAENLKAFQDTSLGQTPSCTKQSQVANKSSNCFSGKIARFSHAPSFSNGFLQQQPPDIQVSMAKTQIGKRIEPEKDASLFRTPWSNEFEMKGSYHPVAKGMTKVAHEYGFDSPGFSASQINRQEIDTQASVPRGITKSHQSYAPDQYPSSFALHRAERSFLSQSVNSPMSAPYNRQHEQGKENMFSAMPKDTLQEHPSEAQFAVNSKEITSSFDRFLPSSFSLQKYFETVTIDPPGITPLKMGTSPVSESGSTASSQGLESPNGYVPFSAPGPLQAFRGTRAGPTQTMTALNPHTSPACELSPLPSKKRAIVEENAATKHQESIKKRSARKKLTWEQCIPGVISALELRNPFFEKMESRSDLSDFCLSHGTNGNKSVAQGMETGKQSVVSNRFLKETRGKEELHHTQIPFSGISGQKELLQELMDIEKDEVASAVSSSWSSTSDDDYGQMNGKSPAGQPYTQSYKRPSPRNVAHPLVNISSATSLEIIRTLSKIELPELKKYNITGLNEQNRLPVDQTTGHRVNKIYPSSDVPKESIESPEPKPSLHYEPTPVNSGLVDCKESEGIKKVPPQGLDEAGCMKRGEDADQSTDRDDSNVKNKGTVIEHPTSCNHDGEKIGRLPRKVSFSVPYKGGTYVEKNETVTAVKNDAEEEIGQEVSINVGHDRADVERSNEGTLSDPKAPTSTFCDTSAGSSKSVESAVQTEELVCLCNQQRDMKEQGTQTELISFTNKDTETETCSRLSIATQTQISLKDAQDLAKNVDSSLHPLKQSSGIRQKYKEIPQDSQGCSTVEEVLHEQNNLRWYQSLLIKLFAPESWEDIP